ncbi:MAG: folate-binding protein [Methylophaga sp.]|nr:folate-binding protein [Methylophaga sp.]
MLAPFLGERYNIALNHNETDIMTNSWQDIITQQSTLSLKDDAISSHCFMPLPQLGILSITGEEAQNFLQNLLTNNVNSLAINQSQLSGFCNAKGRLFAIFQLIRREGGYQIIIPKTMCTTLMQRLSMYVLRAKVTITNISDITAIIGLNSSSEHAVVELKFANNVLIHDDQEPTSRSLCIAPIEHATEILNQLDQEQWKLAPQEIWDRLEIEAGLATIYPETKEKFTPQQVNLDLVNGVSFNKGCYPGQEVVARLHYLGKPSRRMFVAKVATHEQPIVGDEIITKAGDVAGHIVRTQLKDDNTLQLLLSLKLSEQHNPLFIKESLPVTIVSSQFD